MDPLRAGTFGQKAVARASHRDGTFSFKLSIVVFLTYFLLADSKVLVRDVRTSQAEARHLENGPFKKKKLKNLFLHLDLDR